MTSSKPYLIRAIYDWIVDNNLTPYLVINAEKPDVHVPEDYIDNGKIVMNISPIACQGLHIENDKIIFSAKFKGDPMQVYIPPTAVIAIYAKENGKGMAFGEEDEEESLPPTTPEPTSKKGKPKRSRPKLTVVK